MSLSYETVQSFNPKLVGKAVEAAAKLNGTVPEVRLGLGLGLAAQAYFESIQNIPTSLIKTVEGETISTNQLQEISRVILGLAFLLHERFKPEIYFLIQKIVLQLPDISEAEVQFAKFNLKVSVS